MKIQDKITKEIKYAVYTANSSGNMRYNVDGKFLTDKQFDKKFTIVKDEQNNVVVFRSHIRNLFAEILANPTCWVLQKPLQITLSIIAEAARYAATTKDEKMIGYFTRLGIYAFSDPTDKNEFDQELTNFYINKTK